MYIVMEIQSSDGQASTIVNSYDNRPAAESKYHTILASAAISSVPIHSAIMLTDDAIPQKYESYTHPVEPTPEPTPEPEEN